MEKSKYKAYAYVLLVCIAIMASMAQGCKYENEEELFHGQVCDISMVTYSNQMTSILDESCNGCHSTSEASGSIILDTYEDVFEVADSGTLFCSVNHDDGCSEMPQNQPKLTECELLTIKSWIDDGAQNN